MDAQAKLAQKNNTNIKSTGEAKQEPKDNYQIEKHR